jgi:hypothetical protein
MIISRWIPPRTRNVSDKLAEKIKTCILFSITFFRKSCRLWDNVEKYGTARQATDDNKIRRMRFACSITKATDTHSEYVILIAFPRQKWLRERASIVRLYVHCLSCFCRPGSFSEITLGLFHFHWNKESFKYLIEFLGRGKPILPSYGLYPLRTHQSVRVVLNTTHITQHDRFHCLEEHVNYNLSMRFDMRSATELLYASTHIGDFPRIFLAPVKFDKCAYFING